MLTRAGCRYIDYMLLMTYNYHGSGWEMTTGHHSPILPHRKDPPGDQRELYLVSGPFLLCRKPYSRRVMDRFFSVRALFTKSRPFLLSRKPYSQRVDRFFSVRALFTEWTVSSLSETLFTKSDGPFLLCQKPYSRKMTGRFFSVRNLTHKE